MRASRFPIILFDWGDTVMVDDPAQTAPMVAWPEVRAVPGIERVLAYLQASGRRLVLATSADVSTVTQIRGALARVGLDTFFERIYCYENTRLPKGEAFYRHLLADLQLEPSAALMVGDHLEKDVLTPNRLGMYAVWFNERSNETCANPLAVTAHSMAELLSIFRSMSTTDDPSNV
jgi:FMN phosphatase YigB (HAD superfamily)